jgi:hypothetical protein
MGSPNHTFTFQSKLSSIRVQLGLIFTLEFELEFFFGKLRKELDSEFHLNVKLELELF